MNTNMLTICKSNVSVSADGRVEVGGGGGGRGESQYIMGNKS